VDRATKRLVVCWACAAFAANVWLLPSPWPPLKLLTAGVFAAFASLALVDKRAVALILFFSYIFPAAFALTIARYHPDYDVIWMGALLGAILPAALRSGWKVPDPWRAPLVLWALTVAVGTIIVIGREMDFYPALLWERGLRNSASGGGGPRFLTLWILHTGLATVLGILWFDWLFGAELDFRRIIVMPLLASSLALAGVSIYQLFFDFDFLNVNVYGGIGRASGTMFDANVSGFIAAIWMGGGALWASQVRHRRAVVLMAILAVMWLTVWASGSRTAFGAAAVVMAACLVGMHRERVEARKRTGVIPVLGALGMIGVVIALLLRNANAAVVGPWVRFRTLLPDASMTSIQALGWELWNRNGYGSTAVEMIRSSPWFGVGPGMFHVLVADFAPSHIPGDNAQNWYRHQLAELGIVGSLGWMTWFVLLAGLVLWPRAKRPPSATVTAGMLTAFGLISLVGMPTQAVSLSFTFWTVAFWFLALSQALPAGEAPLWVRRLTPAVLLAFAVGTGWLAATRLRVPMRAAAAGWAYSYGFYPPEVDSNGHEYRWAKRRASIVIDAPASPMTISVWVNHLDLHENPVEVKLWKDGELVLQTRLTETNPASVTFTPSRPRFVLDTWASRAVRPSDVGSHDERELALMARWTAAN
jgi:hypothetical protein